MQHLIALRIAAVNELLNCRQGISKNPSRQTVYRHVQTHGLGDLLCNAFETHALDYHAL